MGLGMLVAKLLVYSGAGILIAALIPIHNLHKRLPPGKVRLSWVLLLALTIFFVLGYIAYAAVILENRPDASELIVSSIFFLGSIFVLMSSILSLRTAIDIRRVTLLEHENVTDSLTGIFNRRYLDRRLQEEFARAERYQMPLSILLIDLDNFKTVNDTYGHLVGDEALLSFTRMMMSAIRAADVIARYGGDEFMVVATNTSGSEAYQLAERIRKTAESHVLEFLDEGKRKCTVRVTTSIGVTCYSEEFQSVQSFVACVDQMMYQAKKAGRNRSFLWEECVTPQKDPQPEEIRYTL